MPRLTIVAANVEPTDHDGDGDPFILQAFWGGRNTALQDRVPVTCDLAAGQTLTLPAPSGLADALHLRIWAPRARDETGMTFLSLRYNCSVPAGCLRSRVSTAGLWYNVSTKSHKTSVDFSFEGASSSASGANAVIPADVERLLVKYIDGTARRQQEHPSSQSRADQWDVTSQVLFSGLPAPHEVWARARARSAKTDDEKTSVKAWFRWMARLSLRHVRMRDPNASAPIANWSVPLVLLAVRDILALDMLLSSRYELDKGEDQWVGLDEFPTGYGLVGDCEDETLMALLRFELLQSLQGESLPADTEYGQLLVRCVELVSHYEAYLAIVGLKAAGHDESFHAMSIFLDKKAAATALQTGKELHSVHWEHPTFFIEGTTMVDPIVLDVRDYGFDSEAWTEGAETTYNRARASDMYDRVYALYGVKDTEPGYVAPVTADGKTDVTLDNLMTLTGHENGPMDGHRLVRLDPTGDGLSRDEALTVLGFLMSHLPSPAQLVSQPPDENVQEAAWSGCPVAKEVPSRVHFDPVAEADRDNTCAPVFRGKWSKATCVPTSGAVGAKATDDYAQVVAVWAADARVKNSIVPSGLSSQAAAIINQLRGSFPFEAAYGFAQTTMRAEELKLVDALRNKTSAEARVGKVKVGRENQGLMRTFLVKPTITNAKVLYRALSTVIAEQSREYPQHVFFSTELCTLGRVRVGSDIDKRLQQADNEFIFVIVKFDLYLRVLSEATMRHVLRRFLRALCGVGDDKGTADVKTPSLFDKTMDRDD